MLLRSKGVASLFRCNVVGDWKFRYSSTSNLAPNTHLLEKYLVNSLGFSKEEAASTSSKVTSCPILKNPDSVLTFLRQTGFDPAQIKTMVSKAPKLLFYDVSKTLKPKFKCLMDLGFSGSDLVSVIIRDTTIVERGLQTHLRPVTDILRRILGSGEAVVMAVKRHCWLLSFSGRRAMEANLQLFKEYGFIDVDIRRHVLRNPRNIALTPNLVKDVLRKVEKEFRVPVHTPIFLYGFHVLTSLNNSTLEKKIAVFKSFGWSHDDILVMFRKQPYCIALSEDRIGESLNFYMKELGYESACLASHPSILIYSLERRVVPRMQVLKILDEKKLERIKSGLYSVLCLSELNFIKRFVLPYKDQIPDLYESHKKVVAL